MNEFSVSERTWEHLLAVLLLAARLGDVGSTYLVTPTLRLEANSMVRRFGWRFALLTIPICLLPYYNTALAMVGLVMSLLVTSSNLTRGWVARALGEAEYAKVLQRAAESSNRRTATAFILSGAAASALVGVLLVAVSGGADQWAFWVGVGVIVYAMAIAMHGSAFVGRLFRSVDPARPVNSERF
jgi:hypothetical protein